MPVTATTNTPTVPVPASQDAAAPTTAAAGSVKVQASTMRPATPQCTDASRRPAPAPKMEPVQTWVVDSGSPRWVEDRITAVLVAAAVKPGTTGISRPGLRGFGLTGRPPRKGPSPIASRGAGP